MTPRERVMTVFAHREPDRVPAWCGASPEFWQKAKRELGILDDEELRIWLGDDFRKVLAGYAGPEQPLSVDAMYRTPFGIERRGYGYGQPMGHPLGDADIDKIHDYTWPDAAWTDVKGLRASAEQYNGDYAVLGGEWSPFWHDAIDLLGMENLYIMMYEEPKRVDAVLQHIVDYYAGSSRRIFDVAADVIDIFFIGNDFGSQTGPLLSKDLFRRFILPHLKRLIDLGHDYNLKVMMHCCGGFAPLIPAMIEVGLDALHALQPCCNGMNLAELKKTFGDKIVMNGAIDSHHVLINGSPDSVRKNTREVLETMMPGGGYIASASHDYILGETPVGNVVAMFDAIREFGNYT